MGVLHGPPLSRRGYLLKKVPAAGDMLLSEAIVTSSQTATQGNW